MTMPLEFGVTQVAQRIHLRLRRYLEAQYHIRDSALIEERRQALEEPGGISQRPFVEVTPSYAYAGYFRDLNVPPVVASLLQELSEWRHGVGVFPPYKHQAEALERFLAPGGPGEDLIVATGTGSGKTETFLYAILANLALEGAQRPASWALPGVRALLLYPMNALVSDQTARMRKLLGDPRVAGLFRERWGRHPRFGMYTSRTPYPGIRSGDRDKRHLETLLSYYERLETSTDPEDRALVTELRGRGRWPAKDVVRFFARDAEEKVVVKSGPRAGKENTRHHWDQRFRTHPDDRELLTRHEMHISAPDLLITNYSMLEYMLLRPIERPIFTQTRSWLAEDPRNQLILILDEAHMYRGVGGAEVGLLIRRLTSRLGINRERLRCILTSASLGSGAEGEAAGKEFACALTGRTPARSFAVVTGTREPRSGARPGTAEEAEALGAVSAATIAAASLAPREADAALAQLSRALGWPQPPLLVDDPLLSRQQLCRSLTGFGPLEALIGTCSGEGTAFADLSRLLFPGVAQARAERATDGLLAVGNFARRTEPNRQDQPLLPTRVHLLFRGLPALHVCVNPDCTVIRPTSATSRFAGRLFTEPRTHCDCGGRVYELLTHRDCGAAYLRVFGSGPSADFFWHERGGTLTEFGGPLHEFHLSLEPPHPDAIKGVTPIVLDVMTGRVLPPTTGSAPGTILCYRASEPADGIPNVSTFAVCPSCTRPTQTGGGLKIMDLATKGEQPFANLVREQFVTQVATKVASEEHPNEGRKALLFSDGRQKAARLARDLPREVERDSFREALVLAVQALERLPTPREAVIDDSPLYAAFVSVCSRFHLHFFDDRDQEALLEDCERFRGDYDGDLELAFDSEWKPIPPPRYRRALIRQIGDRYYSLVAASAATVQARRNKLNLLKKRVGRLGTDEVLEDLANAWIQEMLANFSFDPLLGIDARQDEFPWFGRVTATDGLKRFFERLKARARLDEEGLAALRGALFDIFTRESSDSDSGRLISGDGLVLRIAVDAIWHQCIACGHLQAKAFLGACGNCGDRRLEPRAPDHPYMVARKGFFREPLRSVLQGERPLHITAEEHTAQLSQRDAGVVYATTEQFELRFQDVPLGKGKPPVDILSCTTTMEVGIDIGSLTAVGLRTVPPQRENYQQRAGRAGRRGTSVSTVLTFAQGGAHDAYYFANPKALISGPPRTPRIKSDNRRLARRHIHAHLLQTFFHSRFDALTAAEQRGARERSKLMSALGKASEFFFGDGESFTLAAFERWMRTDVLVPTSRVVDEIAAWLPPELARTRETAVELKALAREAAEGFLADLNAMKAESRNPVAGSGDGGVDSGEDDNDSLLDALFDGGLLPSYAFPTDLCSFVIQDFADRGQVIVRERPQLSKAQALSEYAPGRLLVVNKRTYRVGGIFVEGPPTADPVAPLFAGPLSRYVGCACCSFLQMESGAAADPIAEGSPCPVCSEPLIVHEFFDPPAFTPERGRSLGEGDREQEITYASSAQLPEIADRTEFEWRDGPGVHLRHAYGEEVSLVVANKGKDLTGFSVCESCGRATLDGDEDTSASHARPFLLPNYVREREGASQLCSGKVRRGLFLGHSFHTDILLLRGSFRAPFDFAPGQPWLTDALATLAEALAQGASLHMNIDPGELSAGFRLHRVVGDEVGVAEVYLFDTASGGAGYSAEAGADLERVLDSADRLLRECPAWCQRSCTKCLRHYGNRFLHGRLDRRLGADLLRYLRAGEAPSIPDGASQGKKLAPLGRFLSLEGWTIDSDPANHRPLVATSPRGRSVVIGVHPALLMSDVAKATHQLGVRGNEVSILLPDYVVERDLPSAYQVVCGSRPLPSARRRGVSQPPSQGVGYAATLHVRELRKATGPGSGATVRLHCAAPPPPDAFATRVPGQALAGAGFDVGSWLVVRPMATGDLAGEIWIVVLRPRGNFGATGEPWTIARIRTVGDDPQRLQLSYGAATGREFRPERVSASDLTLAGALVDRAVEAS